MRRARVTLNTAAVLRLFLEDPEFPLYAMELMKCTGLPSGTMYPLLRRLEGDGWLASAREDIDPREHGRPARVYYRLVPEAVGPAVEVLTGLSEMFRV